MREPPFDVVYPEGGSAFLREPWEKGTLSAVLRPASFVYERIAHVVRDRRSARRRPLGIHATVISVGNLEVGGNGKTPLAIHLVGELSRLGRRPAYVSRGFKGKAERLGRVTLLAPRSVEPERWPATAVRLVHEDAGMLSETVGDEGAVVAARCPGVPLAFSSDRHGAIRTVCDMFDPTHVVLDDAFQTWDVPRDVDIVLLDAERPVGNGRTLPAGSLRERPSALHRAGIVGFNALRDKDDLRALRHWVTLAVGRELPVFGVRRVISVVDGRSGAPVALAGGSVAALSGIGRPQRFERALTDRGFHVTLALRYPDHFRYDCDAIRRLEAVLARRGIEKLVTTEKDWVKLREVGPPSADLFVARLDLDIVGDDPIPQCEKPQAMPAVSP